MNFERKVEIDLNLEDLKSKLFKGTFTACGLDYTVAKIIEENQAVLLFAPKKEFSMYYNSFAPTVKVYYKDKKLNIFGEFAKSVKIVRIVMYAFCFLIVLSGLAEMYTGGGLAPEMFLIPAGMGLFMYIMTKAGFYFSVKSFLKNLYEELGV